MSSLISSIEPCTGGSGHCNNMDLKKKVNKRHPHWKGKWKIAIIHGKSNGF